MSLFPNLGPHAAFILLSYGAALLIIGGLVLSVMADHRAQKRRLAELEARGITRRSDAGPGT
ncbi:MAG: heme exporter protein CcmD [Bosea sp. (in: a-proteobacteria)]